MVYLHQPWETETHRTALDADAVYDLDKNLYVRRCSGAAEPHVLAGAAVQHARQLLGKNLLSFLPTPLLPFYRETFELCRREQQPVHFESERSTPQLYRLYRTLLHPFPQNDGIVLTHSLILESPHRRKVSAHQVSDYMRNGTVSLCCHCQRAYHPAHQHWDWVPQLLAAQVVRADELCPVCEAYFYGYGAARHVGHDDAMPSGVEQINVDTRVNSAPPSQGPHGSMPLHS